METENTQLLNEETCNVVVDDTTTVADLNNDADVNTVDNSVEPENTEDNSKKQNKVTKTGAVKFLKLFVILNLLSFIRAFSMHTFVIPNGFAPGGISGIASILYNAILPSNPTLAKTWFSPALVSWVLNIPLFIASFFCLDKKFCLHTMITVGLMSFWLWFFEYIGSPYFIASTEESAYNLLAAVASGVCTGISLGFLLRHNSSMGGTDIIGKLIYKKNPVADVQWLIIGCDALIVMASGILGILSIEKGQDFQTIIPSILSPIFYSAISLFVCAETADVIQSGLRASIVFNVISDHRDEIAKAISERMHRGVTMVHATGFYTGLEHNMLVCVVRKKQINQVNDIIREFDPEAFVYITKAKDVSGRGFTIVKKDQN